MTRREFVQDWMYDTYATKMTGPSIDNSKSHFDGATNRMVVSVDLTVPMYIGLERSWSPGWTETTP